MFSVCPGRGGGLGNRHATPCQGIHGDDLGTLKLELVADAVDDHIGGSIKGVGVRCPIGYAVAFGQDALKGDTPVALLAVLVGFHVGFPFGFGTEHGSVFQPCLLALRRGAEAENLPTAVGSACGIEGAGIGSQAGFKGEVDVMAVGEAVDVVMGEGQGFVGGDSFVDGHWGVLLASFVVLIISQVPGLVNTFFKLFSSFFGVGVA